VSRCVEIGGSDAVPAVDWTGNGAGVAKKKDRAGDGELARDGLSTSRIHGSIARTLGVAIVSGQYAPGDILNNEIDSSEQLQVSRSAYREAIRILAAKGLVESRPKTGTRVTERHRWSLLDPEVLAWFFESEPSEEFLKGLYELRMIVEPAAAALAAERRDDGQLERMRKALIQMENRTLATEAGQAADRDFHDTVLEATGNAALFTLSSSIGAAVRWTTIFKQRKRELPRDPMPDHWKVFDAIAAGRPDQAREAMERLVGLALEDTRAAIDPKG
jgi:DNA-binding FadR family transcriptional regulator